MATPEEQLQAAADLATEAADRADGASEQIYEFANGDDNTQVVTDNGLVDTIAKLAADFRAEIVGQTLKATIEEQTLSTGQTTVSTSEITMPPRPLLFIEGSFEQDFEVTSSNTIELGQSYPDGTTIWLLQNVPTEVDDLQTLVDQAQVFADEAEGYRNETSDLADQASAASKIFADTAEGLNNTQGTGEVDRYFSVVSADDQRFIDLYKNNNGVAEFVDSYPNEEAFERVVEGITYTFDSIETMKDDTRLQEGDRVRTYGSVSAGDSGVRDYLVVPENTDVQTGFLFEALNVPGIQARLVSGEVSAEKTVRIPTEFPDIPSAVKWATGMTTSTGGVIEVLIEAGHQVDKGLFVNNANCSGVVISSEDPVVSLSNDFVGVDYPGSATYVDILFLGINAKMPVLNCKFDMGNQHGSGYYIDSASTGYATEGSGVINAGFHALQVRASIFFGQNTDWSGANGSGCRSQHGGVIAVQASNFDNCAKNGTTAEEAAVRASRASTIHLQGSSVRNSGTSAVRAIRATINAQSVDATGATWHAFEALYTARLNCREADASSSGGNGVRAFGSSIVEADSATADDCAEDGFYATGCSVINASNSSANNSGQNGYLAENSGSICATNSSATNCVLRGARATNSGEIECALSDFTGGGLYASGGGKISAQNIKARVGASDSSTDIVINRGSTIILWDTVSGGKSESSNSLTARGIIFSND